MKKLLLLFLFISLFADAYPSLRRKLARRQKENTPVFRDRTRQLSIDVIDSTQVSDSDESTSSASDEILDSQEVLFLDGDEDEALCKQISSQVDSMQDFVDNIGLLIFLVKKGLNSGIETGVHNKLKLFEEVLSKLNHKLGLAIEQKDEADIEFASVIFY